MVARLPDDQRGALRHHRDLVGEFDDALDSRCTSRSRSTSAAAAARTALRADQAEQHRHSTACKAYARNVKKTSHRPAKSVRLNLDLALRVVIWCRYETAERAQPLIKRGSSVQHPFRLRRGVRKPSTSLRFFAGRWQAPAAGLPNMNAALGVDQNLLSIWYEGSQAHGLCRRRDSLCAKAIGTPM